LNKTDKIDKIFEKFEKKWLLPIGERNRNIKFNLFLNQDDWNQLKSEIQNKIKELEEIKLDYFNIANQNAEEVEQLKKQLKEQPKKIKEDLEKQFQRQHIISKAKKFDYIQAYEKEWDKFWKKWVKQ